MLPRTILNAGLTRCGRGVRRQWPKAMWLWKGSFFLSFTDGNGAECLSFLGSVATLLNVGPFPPQSGTRLSPDLNNARPFLFVAASHIFKRNNRIYELSTGQGSTLSFVDHCVCLWAFLVVPRTWDENFQVARHSAGFLVNEVEGDNAGRYGSAMHVARSVSTMFTLPAQTLFLAGWMTGWSGSSGTKAPCLFGVDYQQVGCCPPSR